MNTPKIRKPTLKQKKLVKAKIEGKTNIEAYREAGYSLTGDKNIDAVNASRAINKPHIQQLIDSALEAHGLTPEWAIGELKKVASQDEEVGAKRLAIKDIIELHGWNKADKPNVTVQFKNAFFNNKRQTDEIIDVSPNEN